MLTRKDPAEAGTLNYGWRMDRVFFIIISYQR